MDIWLEDSLENRANLRKAFIAAGMGDYPMVERMQFVPGWTDFRLNNGLRLDVIVEMKGLENFSFEECYEIATIANIEGVDIPFLHINQLIANKRPLIARRIKLM